MSPRLALALLLPLTLAAGPATQPAVDAKAAFEKIKSLAGEWHTTLDDGTIGTIAFKVSSGGAVVLETMFPGTPMEMTNVYHLDNDRLLATHYCAAGNQPRMMLSGIDQGKLVFTELDITNLVDPKTAHMSGVALTLAGDKLTEDWTSCAEGEACGSMAMELTRAH